MKKIISILAVGGFLLTSGLHAQEPAPEEAPTPDAENIDLSDYETVAVQPVMALSDSPRVFEAQLAAATAGGAIADDQKATVHQFGASLTPATDDAGFGFAGKATASDVQMLQLGLAVGILPAMMAADPAAAKRDVARLRGAYQSMRGQLDPEVAKALDAVLTVSEMGDVQSSAKGVLLAMATSVGAIRDGQERPYGYLASGLYAGLTGLFASMGQSTKELGEFAAPLVMMLEEDAAFGGSDRAIAASLKQLAAAVSGGNPSFDAVKPHLAALSNVGPDQQ